MPEVHKYIGFAVVAIFAVGWIWGLGAFAFRRAAGPGSAYWTWLTVAQVVAGLQVLAGVVLLLLGKRPSTMLHYVYGLGPLAILVLAHWLAREGQKVEEGYEPIPPYLWFTGAAFVCFGLTLRALMTGLGHA